jgi:hypothetical protein
MKFSRRHLFGLLSALPLVAKVAPAPAAETLRPFVSGLVFNVPPLRIDPTRLVYAVHEGAVKSILGAYDRGRILLCDGDFDPDEFATIEVPPGRYATCAAAGVMKLGAEPDGLITADVAGKDGPDIRPEMGIYISSHGPDNNGEAA